MLTHVAALVLGWFLHAYGKDPVVSALSALWAKVRSLFTKAEAVPQPAPTPSPAPAPEAPKSDTQS